MAGAIAAAVLFGGVACGDDEKGSTDDGLTPGNTGGSGGIGAGGTGGTTTGGTGGAGGVSTGGNGTGGNGTGGAGGSSATGGTGGADDPGGTGGGDPLPDAGELVIEKVFCRAGADRAVDCDEIEVAIPVHVRITTVDSTGRTVEVFHGEIEEGSVYREFTEPGTYTITEECSGLPAGIECRDPSPIEVVVLAGEISEARLVHDVDTEVYGGGGDGSTCAPLVVKVVRSCKSLFSWTCSLSNVVVTVSGDARASLDFDRRRTSRSLEVPCGHFDLKASTSRRLYICPGSTVSNVSNGSTTTFTVSDKKCR